MHLDRVRASVRSRHGGGADEGAVGLMSASEILVMPDTFTSEAMCSLTSSPLRALTCIVSPLTLSIVPRTRVGTGALCARAERVETATIATAMSGRVKVAR
ncbi:hypothetical protein ACVWZK_002534 [Bradyrhizobium sp. GM0.4]